MFDQYEEENASGGTLSRISQLLRETIDVLERDATPVVDFVRGWDAAGKELRMTIGKSVLADELRQLDSVIDSALSEGRGLRFDL